MRKTLTLILIPIFTVGAVCGLVYYMRMDTFSFAWALNFLLMLGVLAFTEALTSQLTSSYYNNKPWEREGRIYESFGIGLFRKLLVWSGWERLIRKSNPIEKNTRALISLHYQTKKSELGHLIIFIIVLGFNILVAYKFGVLKSLWLLILNVLLNLYPIILQRYNRPRIERAIRLSERR